MEERKMMNKKVEEKANELKNDLEVVRKELRKIQSAKCRLRKQKGRSDYDQSMKELLSQEDLLKEVRRLLEPKDKFVTEFEQEDVDRLDYEQTIKAIRSIQSKKFHTAWLTNEYGDNDEYRNACRIEEMLKKHRDETRPIDDEVYVRKTDLVTIIDVIESSGKIDQERIVEMLRELL